MQKFDHNHGTTMNLAAVIKGTSEFKKGCQANRLIKSMFEKLIPIQDTLNEFLLRFPKKQQHAFRFIVLYNNK